MTEPPYFEPINIVKAIVSDTEKLAGDLLDHMQETTKAIKGLNHAAPTVLTNESDANTRKMLNTTMNLVKRQQELNQILISMMTLLLSSQDFTGWQAELAMKLGGNPQEVLQKMMEMKMRGKS